MKEILKKETLSKSKTKLLLIILAVSVLFLTAVGYVLTFKQVTIIDGKDEINIKTRKETIIEVLEEQEIDYIAEDLITPALDTKVEDEFEIVIKRAVDISIQVDEETYQLLTPVEDVAAAIHQAGLVLEEKDKIAPALDKTLEADMEIIITRALPCTIQVDGEEIQLETTAENVEQALEEAQISLGEKDKISPTIDTIIEEDTKIEIIRVTEEEITEKEDISFNTVRKNSSDMNKGTTKITQKGKKGVLEKQVKVTYEDGKEVSQKVLEEKVLEKPVDQIVKVGTKVVAAATSSRGGGDVKRTLRVSATAYSSQDPGVGTRTSTGATLRKGVIAVDPSVIPYGTKIYVPGYGFGTALDTGGAIRENKIDLAFDTRAQALRFGKKNLTIKLY